VFPPHVSCRSAVSCVTAARLIRIHEHCGVQGPSVLVLLVYQEKVCLNSRKMASCTVRMDTSQTVWKRTGCAWSLNAAVVRGSKWLQTVTQPVTTWGVPENKQQKLLISTPLPPLYGVSPWRGMRLGPRLHCTVTRKRVRIIQLSSSRRSYI